MDKKIWHHYTNAQRKRWTAIIATKWNILQEYAVAKWKTKTKNEKSREKTDEEESEPKVIRPIAHINKIVQDKNDRYGIKLNKNGKNQNFIINLGSLVTLIPIPQC